MMCHQSDWDRNGFTDLSNEFADYGPQIRGSKADPVAKAAICIDDTSVVILATSQIHEMSESWHDYLACELIGRRRAKQVLIGRR